MPAPYRLNSHTILNLPTTVDTQYYANDKYLYTLTCVHALFSVIVVNTVYSTLSGVFAFSHITLCIE